MTVSGVFRMYCIEVYIYNVYVCLIYSFMSQTF